MQPTTTDTVEEFEGRKLTDSKLTLSKAEGAQWPKEKMAEFLAFLERWARYQGEALGRVVVPDPNPGPGTMRWRAEEPVSYSEGRFRP
jgi:hypothetical protein